LRFISICGLFTDSPSYNSHSQGKPAIRHRCTWHKLVEGSSSTRKSSTNPNWAQWNNVASTEIEIRIFRASIPTSLLPTGYSRFPFCFYWPFDGS
jgi:hypothetical protein